MMVSNYSRSCTITGTTEELIAIGEAIKNFAILKQKEPLPFKSSEDNTLELDQYCYEGGVFIKRLLSDEEIKFKMEHL